MSYNNEVRFYKLWQECWNIQVKFLKNYEVDILVFNWVLYPIYSWQLLYKTVISRHIFSMLPPVAVQFDKETVGLIGT